MKATESRMTCARGSTTSRDVSRTGNYFVRLFVRRTRRIGGGIADNRVVRLISIGTPVDKYDFSFLEDCRKPILFVHGEHDEYGDVSRLRELVDRIAAHTPAELRVIKGAGHFFDDQLDELKRVITEWIGAGDGAVARP